MYSVEYFNSINCSGVPLAKLVEVDPNLHMGAKS